MPAFLNLGHDPLQRQSPLGNEVVDTRESHDRLPSLITQWLHSGDEASIWCINGPWSFSAMRSASVALGMLSYHEPKLTTLCLDKKTLYSYLFKASIIDGPCYIYTGQVKSITRLIRDGAILHTHQLPRAWLITEPNARTDCLADPSLRQIRYTFETVPLLHGDDVIRDIHHLFVARPIAPFYRDSTT